MAKSELCDAQKIWKFIKKPIILGTLFCAFASIFFVLPFLDLNSPDILIVETTPSMNILEMMNKGFIALFSFVGLIITFCFKNQLDKKDLLEKSRFEISLKKLEMGMTFHGTTPTIHEQQRLDMFHERCDEKDKELSDKINHMKDNIKKTSYYGSMTIGLAFGSLIFNYCSLGFITDKGLHVYFFYVLIFLFLQSLMMVIVTISIILE